MERAWQVWKTIGGVVLLIMSGIYLATSAHVGHALNRHEAWATFDHATGAVIGEVEQAVDWLSAKGR
jgi:hypothetical protein